MLKSTNEIHAMRPLSPHLSIYRKQISSVLSILHRISGAGLFLGLFIISWGVILYVFTGCQCIEYFASTIWFKGLLFLLSFASFFHLCTGVRHLFWDIGLGFSIKAINMTGLITVALAIVLTLGFWLLIYA